MAEQLPTYSKEHRQVHTRIKNRYGPARNYECDKCISPADHWAWIHGADPYDIDNSYIPLCREHHREYDKASYYSEDGTYKGNCKLTKPQIIAIKNLLATTSLTQRDIAEVYGISPGRVWQIAQEQLRDS